MGLWQNLVSGFRRLKSSLIVGVGGNLEVYTDINSQKAIDEGFSGNTAVYSIVMRDAEKFGSIPRFVFDAKEREEKAYTPIGENDLTKLLNRPNEVQGQDIFFTIARAYYKVCGEAFIWLNRGALADDKEDKERMKMPVLEMYVLPSNYITVVPDPGNLWGVTGYVLEAGGQRIPIHKADVIHWKTPNLNFDADNRTHLRGLPPLTPGYKTLQQNNDATNSAVRMYQNDGAKGVLFNETFDALKPAQQSQIKDIVDAKINNNQIKGAVATLQGKWQYVNLGGTSVDLQLLEGKELSWKELCFLFKVPYNFFDSHSPFAEKQLAARDWISNTLMPACKQLDGELNRVLLKAFGLEGKGLICSDASGLPEMQKNMQELATALASAWWITPNEKREEMGYEQLADKQMDEVWLPSGITPQSQMNDAAEMEKVTQELMNGQIGNDKGGD
jgi:HK97 family phage portal protein